MERGVFRKDVQFSLIKKPFAFAGAHELEITFIANFQKKMFSKYPFKLVLLYFHHKPITILQIWRTKSLSNWRVH